MLNSESKLTGHFERLRCSQDHAKKITIVSLQQAADLSGLSVIRRLQEQSFPNWELLVIAPPGSAGISAEVTQGLERESRVNLENLRDWLGSSTSTYLAFLEPETLWHPERLSHDLYFLETSGASAVCSPALMWSSEVEAYCPPFHLYPNKVLPGCSFLGTLSEKRGLYFGVDVIAIRKDTFIQYLSSPYGTPALAILRSLASENIYCSDKCLSERRMPPSFSADLVAAAAREILQIQISSPAPEEGREFSAPGRKEETELLKLAKNTELGSSSSEKARLTLQSECLVSVIVAFLNPGSHFAIFLESLTKQKPRGIFEVLLVDNGSTDGSRAIAKKYLQQLPGRLVDAPAYKNASYARNVGVRAAFGNKLLFPDSDDELVPGYIAAMAEALDRHDFVFAVVDDITLNEPWVRDAHGRWSGVVERAFGFLDATGPNIGIRRSLFDQIGGWPEYMSASEDIELCWRAQLAGTAIATVPSAVYRYRLRNSMRSLFRQSVNYGKSNAGLYRTFRKHGMPTRSMRTAFYDWYRALTELARARSKARFARATVLLAYCVGRLIGSLRYRVAYF